MPNINGLRYPLDTDVPNIVADIQNLATDINRRATQTAANVEILTSMSGVADGDRVYLVSHGVTVRYSQAVGGWVNYKNDWIIPSIASGWKAYGAANYDVVAYIKKQGVVWIKGIVSATSGSVGSTIFTLPVGYRPSKTKIFVTPSTNSGNARLDIRADGVITPTELTSGGTVAYVGLTVSYPSEA